MNCPVCKSGNTTLFLERLNVPVHQNLVCNTWEEALNVKRGDLSLVECECGFVFNQSFDESLLSYGERYNNDQMASEVFNEYVDSIVEYLGLRNQSIIEIGCGNGAFLKKLCAENDGVGYDPSYIGPLENGRVSFVQGYYEGRPCDIVVCRHVIEHVPDPVGLIATINAPRVFSETPNLDWIIENDTWWDFFYEHCNYFTAGTLRYAFALAGFDGRAREAFGGQYLWYEGRYMGGRREGCNIPQYGRPKF
jgi:SAM-dependent methyltransferase